MDDVKKAPWAPMIEGVLRKMMDYNIRGICLQYITEDGDCYREYWHVGPLETYGIAHLMEMDADGTLAEEIADDNA